LSTTNPRVFGRYEIIRRLGEGGMGEVFLARQVGLAGFDRLVTLKSVLPQLTGDPAVVDAFLDEARIIGAISHPNVVAVLEVGEWEGSYFMAMEYVDGVDLDEIGQAARAADAPPTPRFVASVGRDAALGLDAAHHAVDPSGNPLHVVHRDVTPHNIMVRRDGLVKLLDFGVAKAEHKRQKTVTGIMKGKLGYFSPEQCAGDPLDGRSDQFVLGIVLWELLLGERAFPGENALKVMHRTANERLPPPSSRALVPPALDEIIHRMTALAPTERFARCNDIAAAMRDFLSTTPGSDNEVAATVQRHCGERLDARAREIVSEPVALRPNVAASAVAAAANLPSASQFGAATPMQAAPSALAPAPPPTAMPAAALLPTPMPSPSASPAPPAREKSAAAGSFREFELELGDDGPMLELADRQGGAGEVGATAAAADARDLYAEYEATQDQDLAEEDEDELLRPVEEMVRDDITVVWCTCDGIGTQQWDAAHRKRLLAQLEASAAHKGARFSVVGDDGIVCILGANKPNNELPGIGVRLATELIGTIAEIAADFDHITARVGVATGASPQRDDTGVATPTVRDEAVDRARRLAHTARSGRIMVAQQTQLLTGRRVRFGDELQTLVDHWNVPFAASEVAGFGAPPPGGEVFGRDRELQALRHVVESAARRRAGGALLVGPAGSGKSVLLAEAERVARWKGMVVARASAGRVSVPVPYDTARQLVRTAAVEVVQRLGDDNDALTGKTLLPRAAALLGLTRADGRRLAIFVGDLRAERGVPDPKRRPLMRTALFAYFRAIADEVGACLVLDDIDRIDDESLELLSVALIRMPDTRVACLATTTTPSVSGVFAGLPPLKLEPLDRGAIGSIVHKVALGHRVPAEVHQLVFERAGGNPLATRLLVQLFISSGAMVESSAGWEVRSDLKRLARQGSVQQLTWVLAARLTPAARSMLRLAAAYGTEIPHALFDSVLGGGVAAGTAIDEAVRVGLVEPSDSGGSFRFLTSSVRDFSGALPVERGTAAGNTSAAIATALITTTLDDRLLHHELLSLHARIGGFERAMVASSAATATYHAACGHRALAEDAYRRALMGMYKAASRGEPEPKTIARVLGLVAKTAQWMALKDPQAAADFPVLLLKDLPLDVAGCARAEVQRDRAKLLIGLGRLGDGERALTDALELCGPAVDPESAAETLLVRASLFEARQDHDSALLVIGRALELVEGRDCARRDLVWTLWMTLGLYASLVRDSDKARSSLSRAFAEASRARSVRGVAQITDLTARVWYDARDANAAVLSYDLAAEHWGRWGARAAASQSLQAAAFILAKELQVDEAMTRAVRALALAQEAEWTAGVEATKKLLSVLEARGGG